MKKLLVGLCFLIGGQVQAFDIPQYTGYVNDIAGVLSVQEEEKLTGQIQAIEAATTAEIAVLLIGTTDGVNIQQYGTTVAETWGVGKSDTDNGVLITVAVQDRQWRIDTGYGVEGILPDIQTSRIAERNFPPYFRHNDYYTGLSRGISDMNGLLVEDPSIVSRYKQSTVQGNKDALGGWIMICYAMGLFTGTISRSTKDKTLSFIFLIITIILFGIGIWLFVESSVVGMIAYVIGLTGLFGGANGGTNRFTGRSGFSGTSGFGGFGGGSFGGGGSSGRW